MEYITVSAKTLDDAITEALIQLGVTSDQLDYEVIEKGSAGFLGIGMKQAVIKARRKVVEEPEAEIVEEAKSEPAVIKKEEPKPVKKEFAKKETIKKETVKKEPAKKTFIKEEAVKEAAPSVKKEADLAKVESQTIEVYL